MTRDRDVAAFDRRADAYDEGRVGAWHRRVAAQALDVAASATPAAVRVLDIGCGTGLFLRGAAARWPEAAELAGVDPAPGMLARAQALLTDLPRVQLQVAGAEQLPFPDGRFDLIASVLAFDHWADQLAGLAECARVLAPGGRLVLVDLFAWWLWPTTVVGRRGRARTPRQLAERLAQAGLPPLAWRRIDSLGPIPLVRAVTAAR
jgi:ubiquinone/menaquinone biosynthesis C-methylase UbiE